ncbi:hypothetical protein HU200_036429 [Digitaria exilis]|uniref:ABC transporter domain-containing protein n=1 Tax=Digitaria exilis TaxID=1010633 RepID=A0A835BGK1_9POAL|nr:hypothetical protein HU200_036429 [Digitaria exilis]
MGRRVKGADAHAAGAGKKDKPAVSVSAMLASMDAPAMTKAAKPSKSKPKPSKAPSSSSSYSYLGDVDLPPSDDEDEAADAASPSSSSRNRASRAAVHLTAAAAPSAKDARKKERREQEAAAAAHAEAAKKKALGDHDGLKDFSVTIAAPTSSPSSSSAAAQDNARDIVIDSFSVSVPGVTLLDRHAPDRARPPLRLRGAQRQGQEIAADARPAIEWVIAADEELAALRDERDRLESSKSNDDDRLAEVYEKLSLHGAGEGAARARASKILAGLGLDQAMQAKPTAKHSGGWRMRISLARALFMQPTLLLLDEPTNHLDLRAVMWLEEYLCTQWKNKTLVVVSHDRDFLNAVCTDIINLHEKKLDYYRGNFDDFESGFEQKRARAIREHQKYEKQEKAAKRSGSKAAHEKVVKQVMAKAEKANKGNKGKKNASNDQGDQKPLAVPQRWHDYCVKFHFPEPTELARPLLQLVEAGFSYHPGKQDCFKLSEVDVDIDMGTRVAIVGPNGAGKSTILKLLAGDLEPTEGQVRRSQKLRIGQYSQHFVEELKNVTDKNAVEYLLELHPDQEGMSKAEAVRAKLGKFGLPKENHLTPIAKLSGGQRARVVFTEIVMGNPHVLLLDEPTNPLDMQSIDALADALDEFTGGVVLVSHDSRLISRVCEDETRSQIWVVEDGAVKTFDGTFEDYKDEFMEEIKKEVAD